MSERYGQISDIPCVLIISFLYTVNNTSRQFLAPMKEFFHFGECKIFFFSQNLIKKMPHFAEFSTYFANLLSNQMVDIIFIANFSSFD